MKELTTILKNENLKPKELALLLLTDIHEKQKIGKEMLSPKDKAILHQRIKNFESREDCNEYNSYVSPYFNAAQVNIDVGYCDREAVRIIECLRLLVLSYVINRLNINFRNDEEVNKSIKSISNHVLENIRFYIQELKKVYSGLLAYKKIVDKSTESVGLDINYFVNKVIQRITEQVKKHNENIERLEIKDDISIDLIGVGCNEDLFNETIEQFKSA